MDAKKPKKVGLALGGGAAKGLAHIGVIKVLERAGIEISYIAGTSMGALVGGWYAATRDIQTLENLFLSLGKKDVYPARRIFRKKDGVLFKNNLLETIGERVRDVKMKECDIPFVAVATEVETGDEVVIKEGNLYEAVQASTALPLIFPPVKIDGRLLMDGGFVNPVPADVAREMGAEYVIAVDVSSRWFNFEEEKISPMHIYSVIPKALSVIEYQIARRVLQSANIVLTPPTIGYKWFQFADAKEIIKAGENEVRNKLREIYKGANMREPSKKPFEKFMDFILYAD